MASFYILGSISHWEPFARLVLEAAYESVLIASAINALEGGSRKVFLTTIGGGVFLEILISLVISLV
jgi:hypothetical protein